MPRLKQRQIEQFEDVYIEPTRTNGLITTITTWTDSGKTIKIRENEVTRTNGLITQIVNRLYDVGGILKETQTQTIVRANGLVANITKAIS
ncbi:MAG: hypothetical protein NWE83_04450 [Candidatus Bathyarchaeota archaeon]|nr:hypothetical protein [Candidatus Bathyarchaeota archaeon]